MQSCRPPASEIARTTVLRAHRQAVKHSGIDTPCLRSSRMSKRFWLEWGAGWRSAHDHIVVLSLALKALEGFKDVGTTDMTQMILKVGKV